MLFLKIEHQGGLFKDLKPEDNKNLVFLFLQSDAIKPKIIWMRDEADLWLLTTEDDMIILNFTVNQVALPMQSSYFKGLLYINFIINIVLY